MKSRKQIKSMLRFRIEDLLWEQIRVKSYISSQVLAGIDRRDQVLWRTLREQAEVSVWSLLYMPEDWF